MLWRIFSFAFMLLTMPIWLPFLLYAAVIYKHTDTWPEEEGTDNE